MGKRGLSGQQQEPSDAQTPLSFCFFFIFQFDLIFLSASSSSFCVSMFSNFLAPLSLFFYLLFLSRCCGLASVTLRLLSDLQCLETVAAMNAVMVERQC